MTLPYADWLPQQRWYAGRGRTIATVTEARTRLADDLDHVLVGVAYADGGSETYQVVIGWNRSPSEEFVGVARIGDDGDRVGFDALYDDRSARELLALMLGGGTAGGIRFVPEPEAEVGDIASARVVNAEQSNTSVIYDSTAILKLFRRVVPGVNPDLELNRALARNHSPHVARLFGAVEGSADGQPLSLAMLTAFARHAADGWSMATASARDLLADPGGADAFAGGDFAGEAQRLGEAVASVHATLGDDLGHQIERPPVDRLKARQRDSAAIVPELADRADAITAVLDRLTKPTIMQRIHGDLHLGQTLRTPEHWILIDFEGEPGQPMADRRRPDAPMRDVAGMLRSFDYAVFQLLIADHDLGLAEQADEWSARNRTAFCRGYATVAGVDPREHADLLLAYELDKAAYEVVYESRHRPSWSWIPLRAIDRLLRSAAANV